MRFPRGFPIEQLRSQLLDPYGVDVGILIPDEAAGFSILPSSRLAAELCSAYNDWLVDQWLAIEPRLRGTIVVPAQHPSAAAAEIRRLGDRKEFVGVLPGGARIPYGNPVSGPIWEAADELDLPVVVHVHYEGVGISGPLTGAGHPDFYLEYHALLGASVQGHLASVLCHGVFERYPNVRMVLMEGGLAGYAGLLWRLDTNWKSCRSETPYCVKPRRSMSGIPSASPPSRLRRLMTRACCEACSNRFADGRRYVSPAITRTGTSTSLT